MYLTQRTRVLSRDHINEVWRCTSVILVPGRWGGEEEEEEEAQKFKDILGYIRKLQISLG